MFFYSSFLGLQPLGLLLIYSIYFLVHSLVGFHVGIYESNKKGMVQNAYIVACKLT